MLLKPEKSLVYLTGFMGAGKTTVGTYLADRLGYHFFDLDQLIEMRLAKPVTRIFHEDGAAFFRQVESEILKEIDQYCFSVISLGAGTILDQANLQIMQQTGYLVWLVTEPDTIWQRISTSEKRLLLEGHNELVPQLSDAEMPARIAQLAALRAPFYMEADCRIETTDKSIEEIVDEILLNLDKICWQKKED